MSLRVSLVRRFASPLAVAESNATPAPLLDSRGTRVVLGATPGCSLAMPLAPAANTLFAPRGACLAGRHGPLFVCDTGHHRLLGWRCAPDADGIPADFVIGQPGFDTEGRNARGEAGPATLNVPTGIAIGSGILAVADAWNHRVLLWHGLPQSANQPADVVLGQADFLSSQANRAFAAPRADTLNWCYGVLIHDGALFVADTGNRRVLIWEQIPTSNGAPADVVLGQPDFETRDVDAGEDGGGGMRWPHAIAACGTLLFVADAGRSRVMVWSILPRANGTRCDFLLGQRDSAGADHNRGEYAATASSLNMPYGLAVQSGHLVTADTANSRLLGYEIAGLAMGAPAKRLSGQKTFQDRGDNAWSRASRESLCWPYGVSASGDTLVIADSGNNRVLLWDRA